MKRIFIISGMILGLLACSASNMAKLTLTPSPKLNTIKTENKAFMVESGDLREENYLVLLNDGSKVPKPIQAATNPTESIEKAIANQFASQGFRITENNANLITVDLVKALSHVTSSLLSHKIDTVVKIQITAENDEKKFVKTYSGKAIEQGFRSASNKKLGASFNKLLTAVLQDVADDPTLNLFINENF